MDYFEQKKINEEEIRKFIIDFLFNELYLNGEKSIDGCPRNLMKFLSEKRDRAIKYQTTDEYSTYLYNKFEKIEESTNPLFLNWKEKGYPLLTSKCEEPNLKFVFDFSFSIIRNQYEESYSEYYESFKPVLYGNNKIVDYLNRAKNLIQKDSQVFEIEVIDFLNYYYMVNANCDIYQEFINTIETTKRCISDFIFLYIEYYVYKRFWFEYLLNKENEPTYNNEGSTQVVKKEQEKQKVEIDVKAFKEYFKLDFTKEGDGSNFDKLINDMRGSLNGYNKKDIVALAYIIRKSEKIHHAKYSGTFSKWLREFCALINHEVPTIKANQVKNNIEKLKVTYYYL